MNSAAKLLPDSTHRKLARFYPSRPFASSPGASFPIQFSGGCSVLPSPPLLNRIAKFALLIQFEIDWLGFTLAAIFELTREVSLPDQSVRIVKAARNLSKRYLSKYLWKPVNACGRCAKKSVAHRNAIAVFAPPVAPSLRGGVFIPRPASLRNRHHPERSFARCCLSRGVCAR